MPSQIHLSFRKPISQHSKQRNYCQHQQRNKSISLSEKTNFIRPKSSRKQSGILPYFSTKKLSWCPWEHLLTPIHGRRYGTSGRTGTLHESGQWRCTGFWGVWRSCFWAAWPACIAGAPAPRLVDRDLSWRPWTACASARTWPPADGAGCRGCCGSLFGPPLTWLFDYEAQQRRDGL